jgi:tetratricopeptide (TPR) repeat protein
LRTRFALPVAAVLVCVRAGAAAPTPPEPALSTFEPGVQQALTTALDEFRERAGSAGNETLLGAAWGELGMVYQAHHLQGLARECYNQARRLAPREFRWHYLLAYLYQETGAYPEALDAYTQALVLDPDYLPVRLRRGQTSLALQETGPAIEDFEAVLAAQPAQPAALAGLGQAALQQQRYADAIRYLEAALAADPSADRLHHPLAMAYRHEGDISAARRHLVGQGRTPPSIADPLLADMAARSRSAQYYLERGYAAARSGRHARAVEEFRQAVVFNPEDPAARVSLGQGLLQIGETDLALIEFDAALARDPRHAAARYRRGTVREARGDDSGAAEDYAVAVASDPDYLQARLRLADALMRLARYDEAARAYAEADAPPDQSAFFAYREALARLADGDCAGAIPALEKALEVLPGNGEILQALARSYAACPYGDPGRAAAAERMALQLYEARPDFDHAETLAMAAAANGDWQRAVALQTRLLDAALESGDPALAQRARTLLEGYRAGQPADRPWPDGHAVFAPARLDAGRESPADR